ncbi:MAG: PD-(D/E)XK nuclease family protein [Phycisphaerae bacterium]
MTSSGPPPPPRRRWAELSDADVLGGLADSCARVSARWPADGMPTLARDAYVLQRTWSHLARVLLGQRAVARAGTATPRATELAFGFSDKPGGLPALVLATRGGRRVVVRGYIDRVDIVELADEALGIVIDYKHTRDKRLDMSRVYHGLSLQLLAYLLALADHGQTLAGRPIRPIGALYVGLVPRYRSVDDPSEPDGPRDALPGVERPRGVLRFDELDALEPGGGDAGWCTYYSVYRKKDGGLGNADKSDAVDGPGFRALLDHTRDKLGELADAVLDGDVGVRPCRLGTFSPCSWCTLSSVCRFEMDMSDVRFLETLKQSDVIQRVQAVKRGEATA